MVELKKISKADAPEDCFEKHTGLSLHIEAIRKYRFVHCVVFSFYLKKISWLQSNQTALVQCTRGYLLSDEI